MNLERKTAVIFGAAGFLGRHAVAELTRGGWSVRAGVRRLAGTEFLRELGAAPVLAPLESPEATARALEGAALAVNLVGILAEARPGDFVRLHAEAAGRLAAQAAAAGVARFVHVSAIGADPAADSLYAASKGEGERLVRAAFPEAVILRPSVMFGAGDSFFNRFAAMARLLPVIPIVGGAVRFQPVYVGDVAAAIRAAAEPGREGRVFELGGPDVVSFHELIARALRYSGQRRLIWDMPVGVAKLQAMVLERLPGKLLTRDQIKLLGRDNVAAPDMPGLAALGIAPTAIERVVPDDLARFRGQGGGKK
ncbi:complex I NDUFA9 subunit family protein [Acidocella sp.]|uniref:complex I NDUFA9 subunit family protein n=1 Tax=Acidocella sp. TaxID=50710 RepID=UPI00260DD5E4|nr:complex I NDUFA9 subunit family protein [Acidocella sp.]